ncbi:MAG: hypothetical protein QOG01_18 [Pseudonocardiales bacterium]|nr:hypothetical protein [Pseudonocardiales bacterium]
MKTYPDSVNREVHEVYIAKINNLIAEGRESLITGLVDDFDRACREEPASTIGEAA